MTPPPSLLTSVKTVTLVLKILVLHILAPWGGGRGGDARISHGQRGEAKETPAMSTQQRPRTHTIDQGDLDREE